jgi:hypothetical protein
MVAWLTSDRYNSTIVVNRATQLYDIALITPEFLSGGPWYLKERLSDDHKSRYDDRLRALQDRVMHGQFRDEKRWENISAAECKDDLNFFRSDRGSVLLVSREDSRKSTPLEADTPLKLTPRLTHRHYPHYRLYL